MPARYKAAKSQLVVPEPTALLALDTPKIIIAPGAGESLPADTAQWRDNIPKLLQAKLIESFENSNYLAAVARPMEGLFFMAPMNTCGFRRLRTGIPIDCGQ